MDGVSVNKKGERRIKTVFRPKKAVRFGLKVMQSAEATKRTDLIQLFEAMC